MKRVLILVLGLFVFCFGFGSCAPVVEGVNGDVLDGGSVVLDGSDFGENALDVSWIGDDIESTNIGLNPSVSGWDFFGWNPDANVQSDIIHSGSKSIKIPLKGDGSDNYYAGTIRYNYPEDFSFGDVSFVSWWVRQHHTKTDGEANQWKMIRGCWENSITDAAGTQFKTFDRDVANEFFVTPGDSTTVVDKMYPNNYPSVYDRWYRVDLTIKAESLDGADDGEFVWTLHDPTGGSSITSSVLEDATLFAGINDFYRWILWQNYVGNGITASTIWMDDFYVQTGSVARVELGDAAVWEDCTWREIQIPTVWSNGLINVDFNQGSFQDGETAYLFVVDSDGEVSDGFEIVISGEVSGCVEGVTVGCSTGLDGICSSGLRTCVDGVYGECVQDNVSVEEICGNGVDEDCDGGDLECSNEDFVVDHTSAQQFDSIPESWTQAAKDNLHIVYQHTSHGSQLVSGMNALENYVDYAGLYEWSDGGYAGLDLDDVGIPGASDLGYEDAWPVATRALLDNPANSHVNVVLWSWCNIAGHDIAKYLADMDSLIVEYPDVDFVYITGHANGGGEGDSSDSQNELIREHVALNGGILFDFADFENYDPDDNYFLDLNVQDDLDYSGGNWASEYLDRYTGSDYESLTGLVSSCAHSDVNPDSKLNCVLKGQGAWYLFARLAGWDGGVGECVDLDGDGYCVGVDCDDSDELVYPGAEEICGDFVDQDCDGEDLVCESFHDADLDKDGGISVEELEGYIGIWLVGGVSMGEVMGAIVEWVG